MSSSMTSNTLTSIGLLTCLRLSMLKYFVGLSLHALFFYMHLCIVQASFVLLLFDLWIYSEICGSECSQSKRAKCVDSPHLFVVLFYNVSSLRKEPSFYNVLVCFLVLLNSHLGTSAIQTNNNKANITSLLEFTCSLKTCS